MILVLVALTMTRNICRVTDGIMHNDHLLNLDLLVPHLAEDLRLPRTGDPVQGGGVLTNIQGNQDTLP